MMDTDVNKLSRENRMLQAIIDHQRRSLVDLQKEVRCLTLRLTDPKRPLFSRRVEEIYSMLMMKSQVQYVVDDGVVGTIFRRGNSFFCYEQPNGTSLTDEAHDMLDAKSMILQRVDGRKIVSWS
jgi:hypothetical protein